MTYTIYAIYSIYKPNLSHDWPTRLTPYASPFPSIITSTSYKQQDNKHINILCPLLHLLKTLQSILDPNFFIQIKEIWT